MEILKIDIEKYENVLDPTNISQHVTEWTIHENDLQNMRQIKNNFIKSRKRKNNIQLKAKANLPGINPILNVSKIPKLNEIESIIT